MIKKEKERTYLLLNRNKKKLKKIFKREKRLYRTIVKLYFFLT